MTTTTTTIAERVAAGAAWLDEHQPDWLDRIDLDDLDLSSTCGCILGQLDGDYDEAREARGLHSEYATANLGFNIDPDGDLPMTMGEEYAALTAAWRELIETRRAGAS